MPQHGYTGSHIGAPTGTWNEETELDGRSRKLEPAMRWSGFVREEKEGVTSVAGGTGTGPILAVGPIPLDNQGIVFPLTPTPIVNPVGTPVPLDGILVGDQPYAIEFDAAGVTTAVVEFIGKDGWGRNLVVRVTPTVGLALTLVKATFKRLLAVRIIVPEVGGTISNIRQAPEAGLKYPLGSTDGTCVLKELLNGSAPAVAGTFVGPDLDPLVGDPRGTYVPDPAAGGPNDYDLVYIPSRVDQLTV